MSCRISYIRRQKRSDTIVCCEINHVRTGVQSNTVDIFFLCKSVAAHITDKLTLGCLPLPYTERGGTPYVAAVILNDIRHRLSFKQLSSFKQSGFFRFPVIEIKATVGTDKYIAFACLTKRQTHHTIEQFVPSL